MNRLLLLVLPLIMLSPLSPAATPPRTARTLIQERDQLYRQLLHRDQEAVEAWLQGRDAVPIHADQTGLQERIDMLQMRLESLAIRHGFEVPPLSVGTASDSPVLEARHLAIGRSRTRAALADTGPRVCRAVVGQIDFTDFLDF